VPSYYFFVKAVSNLLCFTVTTAVPTKMTSTSITTSKSSTRVVPSTLTIMTALMGTLNQFKILAGSTGWRPRTARRWALSRNPKPLRKTASQQRYLDYARRNIRMF